MDFFSFLKFLLVCVILSFHFNDAEATTGNESRADIMVHGVISDHRNYENASIIIDGNLTIVGGGLLNLKDSTLTVISTYNGSTDIIVDTGGIFTVDNTKMRSSDSYAYTLRMMQDSVCRFSDSEARNCGFACNTEYKCGLWTESDNLTIADCSIYFEGAGLISRGSAVLQNTSFYPNLTYLDGKISGIGSLVALAGSKLEIINCSFNGGIGNSTSPFEDSVVFQDDSIHALIRDSIFNQSFCLLRNCDVYNTTFTGKIDQELVTAAGIYNKVNNSTITNLHVQGTGLRVTMNKPLNITNSSITAGSNDIQFQSPNSALDLNIINSSFNSYDISGSINHINVFNFLSVKVIGEKEKKGIPNATLNISDSTGKRVMSDRTDADGFVSYIPMLWKDIMQSSVTESGYYALTVETASNQKSVNDIDMSTAKVVLIIIDDVPPQLTIAWPYDGLITNSSVLNVSGSTDTDARVTVNDQSVNNINGKITQTWWLEEGLNTLVFKAQDPAGNIAEVVRNVTLKTVGPSIRISEPKDGFVTNQNTINISGTTNGTRVEIEGTPVHLETDGSFAFNYSFHGEGQHSIIATAWDEVNNSGFARVRVEYDITPPSIEIISPLDGSRTNINSIEVKGKVIGASNATMNGQDIQIGSEGLFSRTIQLIEGWNEIVMQAQDIAGNTNATSVRVFLDTKIQLNITSPTDGILINTSTITIQGATDSDAVITIGNISVQNFAGNFSQAVQLTEGLNKVIVSSVDQAGNRIERTVRITVDTIPPGITILSPLESSVKLKDLELRLRSEPGAIVTVNGVQINGTGDLFIFTGSLQKGVNIFTITARDAAGNVNTTEKSLTYVPTKKAEPPVTTDNGLLWPILAIVVVAVLAIIGYFYLRKKPDGTPPPPPENPA
jgi:hypothetical protein